MCSFFLAYPGCGCDARSGWHCDGRPQSPGTRTSPSPHNTTGVGELIRIHFSMSSIIIIIIAIIIKHKILPSLLSSVISTYTVVCLQPIRPYSYSYDVSDPPTYNFQNKAEIKTVTGDVFGSYSVLMPDNYIYTTTYNVTGNSGYIARLVKTLAQINRAFASQQTAAAGPTGAVGADVIPSVHVDAAHSASAAGASGVHVNGGGGGGAAAASAASAATATSHTTIHGAGSQGGSDVPSAVIVVEAPATHADVHANFAGQSGGSGVVVGNVVEPKAAADHYATAGEPVVIGRPVSLTALLG